MNICTSLLMLLPVCALAGCTTMGQSEPALIATAPLINSQGQPIGSAKLVADDHNVVILTVAVTAVPVGTHGIHMHTTGKCESPGFTTAAGHLNPTDHQHGSMNPAGPHLGDLPNLLVSDSGTGTVSVPIAGNVTELESQLFDADGTAIIIHAGPDDYKTDPSGNSGSRIACGVLSRP
jgi:Cu-Zn family superoxide dismutase